jgi:hypothetical protein
MKQHRAKPRRRAVRLPGPSEDDIQIAVVTYLRMSLPHGWIVQHTANKPRSKAQGGREKRLGAVAGWPDLAILGRRYDDAGDGWPVAYFLECKTADGRVSPEQRDIHALLMDCGWRVRVVRSVDDVRRACWDWDLPVYDAHLAQDFGGVA